MEEHNQIRELYRAWFDAMEHADIATSLSLLTDDVILKPPTGPTLIGKAAVRSALEKFHDEFTETVTYSIDEINCAGTMAYVRFVERAKVRSKSSGTNFSVSGTHLSILRHDDDRVWRIARDVSSLDTVPSALDHTV